MKEILFGMLALLLVLSVVSIEEMQSANAACQPDTSKPCYTDTRNRNYVAKGRLLPDSDCWNSIYVSLRPTEAYEFVPTPLLNKQTWINVFSASNNDKPDAGPSTPSTISFTFAFDGRIVTQYKQGQIHLYVETKDPNGHIKVVNRYRDFDTKNLNYEFNSITVYTNKAACS